MTHFTLPKVQIAKLLISKIRKFKSYKVTKTAIVGKDANCPICKIPTLLNFQSCKILNLQSRRVTKFKICKVARLQSCQKLAKDANYQIVKVAMLKYSDMKIVKKKTLQILHLEIMVFFYYATFSIMPLTKLFTFAFYVQLLI